MSIEQNDCKLTEQSDKTMYQELLELGMKEEEISSHCSDLYVLKNAISTKYLLTYKWKQNVTIFHSQIDGKVWYDVPFAFTEYYNKRIKGG